VPVAEAHGRLLAHVTAERNPRFQARLGVDCVVMQ